jgi:hypothetical protein
MTILGKILVILNLVFTLVVGALIVFVYTASTNWQAAYKKMEENYKAARAAADVNADQAVKAETRAQAYENEANHRHEDDNLVLKNAEKDKDAVAVQLRNANEALAGKTREVLAMQDDVHRSQEDKKVLEIAVKDGNERNKLLSADVTKVTQDMIAYKLEAESLRGRMQVVVAQLKESQDQLKLRGGATEVRASKPLENPAPRDVEGVITQVDGDLMAISVGSDSGIKEGHTLDAYRLIGDKAQWLGTVRVVRVNFKDAVAQPLDRKFQPKAGDHVGTIGH